jgi:hypothetical protein
MTNPSLFNPIKGTPDTYAQATQIFLNLSQKLLFAQVRANNERQPFEKIKVQIPHNQSSISVYSLLAEIQSPYIWTTVVPAA